MKFILSVLAIVWVIVVLSLAGVVVIALVIGIAAWCVHKKRQHGKNCRSEFLMYLIMSS